MSHPRDELTAYLDGALSPSDRDDVEEHLASCAQCRAERDRLARTVALLEALPPAPAPSPDFEQRFQARLALAQGERRERGGLLGRLAWRWMAPVLASAALAAVVVVTSHRSHERRVAEHLELLENYAAVASLDSVEDAEDAAVVAHLDELVGRP